MGTLLPINSRVSHFDGGPDTHGVGTIVDYNLMKQNAYAKERLVEATDLAASLGCLDLLADGFYHGDRYPYVVQWDPSAKYPQGYRDVYEPSSINLLVGDQHGNHKVA